MAQLIFPLMARNGDDSAPLQYLYYNLAGWTYLGGLNNKN